MPDIPSITCGLCLQGDPVVVVLGARYHRAPEDETFFIVCADSSFFPVDIPIAPKVASA
jgi:hypothetical protein